MRKCEVKSGQSALAKIKRPNDPLILVRHAWPQLKREYRPRLFCDRSEVGIFPVLLVRRRKAHLFKMRERFFTKFSQCRAPFGGYQFSEFFRKSCFHYGCR